VLGFFDGGDVGGFFHDAHQPPVPGSAAAVNTGINVGDVVADRAQAKIGLYLANRHCQGFRVVV